MLWCEHTRRSNDASFARCAAECVCVRAFCVLLFLPLEEDPMRQGVGVSRLRQQSQERVRWRQRKGEEVRRGAVYSLTHSQEGGSPHGFRNRFV